MAVPRGDIDFEERPTPSGAIELWGKWNGLESARLIGPKDGHDFHIKKHLAELSIWGQFEFQVTAGDV